MTAIYNKNNHFHITTGEVWDLEALQDTMRDVIAPYSVQHGSCNLVIDLSQLSERHLYNKSFALSMRRFIDNIYGVKIAAVVIPDDNNRQRVETITQSVAEASTPIHWMITSSYQLATTAITRGI